MGVPAKDHRTIRGAARQLPGRIDRSRLRKRLIGEISERRTAPQLFRFAQQQRGTSRVTGSQSPTRSRVQPLAAVGIGLLCIDLEQASRRW